MQHRPNRCLKRDGATEDGNAPGQPSAVESRTVAGVMSTLSSGGKGGSEGSDERRGPLRLHLYRRTDEVQTLECNAESPGSRIALAALLCSTR